ncbi:pirin family protein [Leptolyngbya sp. FACHB-36]|uniref:pirin family protein n=1 Tax=Leptolyngbya sp. FACHB-36 TaxID=2692808 RepID=UPI0016803D4D|nr:pirin family protein [Leptolyngbya sp. FACHB-36]MBD2022047.1 pirin family protein [Leptolyngbya sp. FACHB-36]
MITLRQATDCGHADHGWLNSYHTFSFASYYDPKHMGFRDLRVINEDRVAPGRGFPTHSHRDMEIISYVISGSLAHKDSLGNTEVVSANGVQRFSAGTGIAHSEFNPSATDPVHFLQIWILPEKQGLTPSYEQKLFPLDPQDGWRSIANPDASSGAVKIHQNVALFATTIAATDKRTYTLQPDRHAWVQVVKGTIVLNGQRLHAGDGAAVSEEPQLTLLAETDAEVLLFDLA